jgi:hypothetical protein
VDPLLRIKRLAVAGRIEFTLKAEEERLGDGLSVEEVLESILNAASLRKVLRSRSTARRGRREPMYVIESPSFCGVWIYTKGVIRRKDAGETFYVLVSSKIAR